MFAVAFFKAWRALNLLGFAFTFGVGTIWGGLHYEPALFASTEPFLIAAESTEFFAIDAWGALFVNDNYTKHFDGWSIDELIQTSDVADPTASRNGP